MTIHTKQSDIDVLAWLIEIRDAADLAGHIDDLFREIDFQGPDAVVLGPGRNNRVISKLTIRRLRDLGLFYVINGGPTAFTFDLIDDVRDQLAQMRTAAGRPSEPQRAGDVRDEQPRTGLPPRRRGRPKGTRSVPRQQIIDAFRALRTNYGRNPTQSELVVKLEPRIEVRALQEHLVDYGLPWPVE